MGSNERWLALESTRTLERSATNAEKLESMAETPLDRRFWGAVSQMFGEAVEARKVSEAKHGNKDADIPA